MIYDPVDVRISVSNTNVRSDGGGGRRCPEPPDPPLDLPLFCMNARAHHGAIAGFPKQNDKCQINALVVLPKATGSRIARNLDLIRALHEAWHIAYLEERRLRQSAALRSENNTRQ